MHGVEVRLLGPVEVLAGGPGRPDAVRKVTNGAK